MSAAPFRSMEGGVSFMPEDYLLAEAGLVGWKAKVRALDETGDWVCILTSPDYNPAAQPPAGRLFAGRGRDDMKAIGAAIAKVQAATQ